MFYVPKQAMDRRLFLVNSGVVVIGVSGCQKISENTMTNKNTDRSCREDADKVVELQKSGTISPELNISITAEIDKNIISSDKTATLQTSVINEGEDREINIRDDSKCHLFNRGSGRSTPPGIWIYRDEDTPDDRLEDCWTRNLSSEEEPPFDDYSCPFEHFPTGDSITTSYEIWDDHTNNGYLSPGTYRFDTVFMTSGINGGGPNKIDWWIELQISNSME